MSNEATVQIKKACGFTASVPQRLNNIAGTVSEFYTSRAIISPVTGSQI